MLLLYQMKESGDSGWGRTASSGTRVCKLDLGTQQNEYASFLALSLICHQCMLSPANRSVFALDPGGIRGFRGFSKQLLEHKRVATPVGTKSPDFD